MYVSPHSSTTDDDVGSFARVSGGGFFKTLRSSAWPTATKDDEEATTMRTQPSHVSITSHFSSLSSSSSLVVALPFYSISVSLK